MEIRHLKYFLAVAKELNFTKAAEKLFISQPPLSRQIKELEVELGAQLFERNNKNVKLTNAGQYFEQETSQIIKTLEAVSIQTKKISENVNGEFRIGYISSTFSNTISKLVQFLTHKYPYLKIKLYETSTLKQISALEVGMLDLGILRAPIVSTKIDAKLWFKDSYSLVYNKNYMNLKSINDFGGLKEEVFVFFNKDYAPLYYNSLIEICAKYGFKPNIVHESNNINSIIQLVKNGLGISIVPSNLAKNNSSSDIVFLDLKEINLSTNVLLATPKKTNSEITDSAILYLLD